ncbi:hypothetical protein B0H12DRAFT_1327414 [Mycena haematopus]|nr:hypothetical protein B0H12DRAFT_1327414 [Mycena haematopus]
MSSSPSTVTPKVFAQLAASKISPVLIGSLLNFVFFGTLVAQVYIYHLSFSKDSWIVQSLVYFLLFAITIDSCLMASDVSWWYVTSFGDVASFANPRFSNFYAPIMGSFIAMLVHFFFCFRIFVIRRAVWPVCILIALISMAQFVGGLGSGAFAYEEEFKIHSTNANEIKVQDRVLASFLYLWLTGGAVADVLIAIIMTTLILKADMHSSTRGIVKDIVHLILETNTFSAVVDLLALCLFVGFPSSSYCSCPGIIIPGIYANTLLATLNNRAIILRNRTSNRTKQPYSQEMEMSLAVSGENHVSATVGTVGNVESDGNVGNVESNVNVGNVESVESMTFEGGAGSQQTEQPN